jgi:CheY-like chemotaxis protein
MGGDIAVTSTPGVGSTFKASLMLASISKPHPEFITAPVQTIYGYKGTVRTLMLVDDEASHRQLMRAMLAPLGFEIIELDNPLLALDRLMQEIDNNRSPDLIMLDVSMPGINGWQLAKQLREAGYHSPIIMVSADASEGKDLPAHDNTEVTPLHDAYVIKPVRINLLLDHIGRLLNLVWCYEKQESAAPASQLIGALELPADNHLDDIAHLAAIGHKKGLQDKIQELEKSGTAHSVFIQELKKLTANFQFEKILALVDAENVEEQDTEVIQDR